MTGTARSNNPDGPSPVEPDRLRLRPSVGKVRELQRKLWAAAKQSQGRRFHALYDRVHRGDVLWEAWRRVLTNRGSAGVDQKRGRNLRAGQAKQWNEDWFNGLGLHRLRGTIRYPKTA